MKWILLIICISYASSEDINMDDLRCDLKICGSELLNFEEFNFVKIFRKMELANFCVKNCTPPVVHEFFQSIIYGITKRIPGHCSGADCVDKNRFVALAKCVEHQAWPLLQCSKRLIDLAQNVLIHKAEEFKRNMTCSIVTETTQCIEENLQRCGEEPFGLVKEIVGDLVKAGINAYCHEAYRKEGWFMKRTTAFPTVSVPTGVTEDTGPPKPHPQYVKGYNPNAAYSLPTLSHVCLCGALILSALVSYQFR